MELNDLKLQDHITAEVAKSFLSNIKLKDHPIYRNSSVKNIYFYFYTFK